MGISGIFWIDGSYVTRKDDPSDIDLVLFIPDMIVSRLSEEQANILDKLCKDKEYTKSIFKTDFYYVVIKENDYSYYQSRIEYWYGWWSRLTVKDPITNAKQEVGKKGFISLIIGDLEGYNIDRILNYGC